MRRKDRTAFHRVWKEFESWGVLLVSDARLPSVAGLVAEVPLGGSWWAHPQSHEIFRVARALAASPEVLGVRLLSGKETFVQRKLWPALFAVATASEPWQLEGLSPLARSLFARVRRKGLLRCDRLAATGEASEKALGEAARHLEIKLLVYGESLHTERGAHTKQVESWAHLARRLRFKARRIAPPAAKQQFERIATNLQMQFRARVRLPWPTA